MALPSSSGIIKPSFTLCPCGSHRDARVSDYLEHNSSSVVWSPIFVQDAFQDDDSVAQLFSRLDGVLLMDSSFDMVRCNLNASGKFTVKSYFLHLSFPVSNSLSSPYVCGFLWSAIWKSSPSSKVSFFVWEASQGKILTCDHL